MNAPFQRSGGIVGAVVGGRRRGVCVSSAGRFAAQGVASGRLFSRYLFTCLDASKESPDAKLVMTRSALGTS
jgi:hypothetical protein